MNRLPAKQIYLLTIIIVGIIALSVYSTYALFTFESSTSDIVTIHTPKSLKISENIYEYQQLTIAPNTVITTDIDIYNAHEYEICYSVWYKVIGESNIENKVQVFEQSEEGLTSSGLLETSGSKRITIIIINDNDEEIKINIGTIGSQKQENSCSLNLSDDKKVISLSYTSVEKLTAKLLKEKDLSKELEEGYLTYKDITETITYNNDSKIYVSDKFNYNDELFILEKPEHLTFQELIEKKYLENKDIYICQGNGTECSILYKITKIETEELTNNEEKIINYNITKYDKLIGYSKGKNGLRKVNKNDYVYYGDNPNNFIYYNCQNNEDLATCELWRIIGFFYNEETKEYSPKIIRNNSIGKYQYDYKMINNENKSTNIWENTTLYKYLNEEYELKNNYEIYIDEYIEKKEIINSLETDIKNMKKDNDNINSKIRILNLSDYLYSSICEKNKINEYTEECIKNNWLNNIEIIKEWTLTSKEVIEVNDVNNEINTEVETDQELTEEVLENEIIVEDNTNIINYVYSIGQNIEESNVNDYQEIRPVVFLKSRMLLLDGNGSLENPYVVK